MIPILKALVDEYFSSTSAGQKEKFVKDIKEKLKGTHHAKVTGIFCLYLFRGSFVVTAPLPT